MSKSHSDFNFKRATIFLVILSVIMCTGLFISYSSEVRNTIRSFRNSDMSLELNPSFEDKNSQQKTSSLGALQWEEYTNKSGKYSIKYPSTWTFTEEWSEEGGVVFFLKDPKETQEQLKIGVSVAPLPDGGDALQIVNEKLKLSQDMQVKSADYTEYIVNGNKAVEITGQESQFKTIETIITNNTMVYIIWASPLDRDHPLFGEWVLDLETVYRGMVESFRLVE